MRSEYGWRKAVACEQSILPLTSSSIYLFYSYLDEIHRITAKKYIPTDGM